MGAWIEILLTCIPFAICCVAPFVGAWIEMRTIKRRQPKAMMSLPSWERGLKFLLRHHSLVNLCVAPFVGAWIEIHLSGTSGRTLPSLPSWERGLKSSGIFTNPSPAGVAPFVGAWIEIFSAEWTGMVKVVAPFVGAWIEIITVRISC